MAATLDLAETREERTKACEEMLKYAEDWERTMVEAKKNGQASAVEPRRPRPKLLI